MFEISELFKQVSRLKRSEKFVANNFCSAHDLARISERKGSCFLWNEGAALVVNCDGKVNRAYFFLESMDAVSQLRVLVDQFPDKPVVVDCVGRVPQVDRLSDVLRISGFRSYAKLSRWKSGSIRFGTHPLHFDNSYRAAENDDCLYILRMLNETFDQYISHLPSKEKLLSLIENQLVFCASNDEEIIAVVCLEKIGAKAIYSYQNAVLERYRAMGIGGRLLQYGLYQFRECTQYSAWIEDNNIVSKRMHNTIGFTPDGLKDHVLIYE